jgi:hypothetical protein
MRRLIILLILLGPLVAHTQQPKMYIKFFAGFNISGLDYKVEDVDTDILGGAQLGGGFRIERRALMLEIDFAYIVQSLTLSPRLNDKLEINEDVTIIMRSLDIPFLAGYSAIKTPVFGIFLYGGLSNRFSFSGWVEYKDEDVKFKPKEAQMHIYNLGVRFGTQIDLAMFTFDLSYTVGVTNSFRDQTRTNSHTVMLNFGFLF